MLPEIIGYLICGVLVLLLVGGFIVMGNRQHQKCAEAGGVLNRGVCIRADAVIPLPNK
jgi:hypothetical protein